MIKLAICTVSCRNPSWHYVNSIMAAWAHTASNGIRNSPAMICLNTSINCPALVVGRQGLLDASLTMLENGMLTHVCFIDDDMKFPANLFDYILYENEAIGVNCRRKDQYHYLSTAVSLNNEMLESKNKTGIEEVSSIGLGIFCFDLKLIKKISSPHFAIPYREETQYPDSEDRYFVNKLRETGVKIKISHDASNLVGHCGEYVYKL